ncbi:MAG: PA14 domain-containing protein [Planctomycetota bacterium]
MLVSLALVLAQAHVHHPAPSGAVPSPRPPAAAATTPVDREIALGVRRGLLRYDKEVLFVKCGDRVRVRLTNVDDMLHNFVLLAADGDIDAVSTAALGLGAEAMARQFVPALPQVFAHTPLAEPGHTVSVDFVAPQQPCDQPFLCTLPGHAATMRGLLRVSTSGGPLADLRFRCLDGEFDQLRDMVDAEVAKEGVVADGVIDLGVAARDNDFGLVFEGRLSVPRAGRQVFHLDSDDGARLSIDGVTVVDRDGTHPAGDEQTGEVELSAGEHDLCLEYFQRRGSMALRLAWTSATQPRIWLTRSGRGDKAARQELIVVDEPIVQRAFVEDGPPRAIAVGLPGGVSLCFDAEHCCVASAWRGGFLDVGPDRSGRGGKACRRVGTPFLSGDAFALRVAGEPADEFRAYRVEGRGVVFEFAAGERRVEERLEVDAQGSLACTFRVSGEPAPVELDLARAGLRVTGSAGTWDGDVLRLPTASSQRFTLTVGVER